MIDPLKKYVYIYRDEGADPFFVSCLSQEITKEVRDFVGIRFINAEKLINNPEILNDAAAFVMPGGHDTGYAKKLNGIGNQVIKDYVRHGGSYIGFCAGAYYACKNIEYAKGEKKEILSERELGFFNGKAEGPVANLDELPAQKFPASAAKVELENGETTNIYYQEGPSFEAQSSNNNQNHSVIASYLTKDGDKKNAAIECQYGQGRAVLCGFHPEVSGKNFLEGFKEYYPKETPPQDFIETLNNNEIIRKQIFQKILKVAGIEIKRPPISYIHHNQNSR
ncbi:MAG: BPL-N domain-containing protein [Alphaproteobacteria bacterium]